jgi:hypothetical protein
MLVLKAVKFCCSKCMTRKRKDASSNTTVQPEEIETHRKGYPKATALSELSSPT